MRFETDKLKDQLRASTITTRSTLAHLMPNLLSRHVGSTDPNYVPVRWCRAFISDSIEKDWLTFQPNPDPTAIAQLSADKRRLDEVAREHQAVPAVAYRLSSLAVRNEVILAGRLEYPNRDQLFGTDPEDPGRYAVGVRGIRQGLAVMIGVFEPDVRRFWPVHDELSERAVVSSSANTLPAIQRLEV